MRNKPEILAAPVVEGIRQSSARIYRADAELVRRLRSLMAEFGIVRVNRALRQLKTERALLREARRRVG